MTPQEEIRTLMLRNGLSYQWLADKLGTYYQKIQYALEIQKELPLSMYVEIMKVFEKHGFVDSGEAKGQNLAHLAFLTNSTINEDLKRMNQQIAEDLSDGKISPEEKLKLRMRIEDIQRDFNDAFNKLIKLLTE